MKYSMKRVGVANEDGFEPFSITLYFETFEEYVNFRNNAMGKITKSVMHEFHGDVYFMGRGEINEANGEIVLKDFCQTCNKPHEKTYGKNNEWCENCVPY